MKKSAVLLGNVCLAALLAGQVVMLSGCKEEKKAENAGNTENAAVLVEEDVVEAPKKSNISSYWDEQSDINVATANGTLPLIEAVKAGDVEAITYLLDKGARVSAIDSNKDTAIHAALRSGQSDIFNLLYAKEAVSLRQAKYLSDAIEGNNVELVKNVLDSGINVNITLEINGLYRPDEELDYMDKRVVTALKKAVTENKPEIASFLLEHGAEGVQFFLLQALTEGNVGMVKALIEKVGNLRQLSAKGMDLLSASVLEANPEMISILLQKNVGDVNAALFRMMVNRNVDDDFMKIFDAFLKAGATPTADMLQYTLKKKKKDQFEKLASCLVNPNIALGGDEDNLFLYSLRHKYDDAVKFLLDKDIDIFQRGHDGVSALEFAVKIMDEKPEIYEAIKSKLKDVNSSGYSGETLLMILAQNGQLNEFQNIVNAGGNIWQKDHEGKTVLMYAAEGGNEEIINFLMKKGDNLSVADKYGRQPLMFAARAGQLAAVDNFINKGAITSEADDEGKKAIMYAAEGGHSDVVSRLLDEGESASVFDKNRKTVLMYALESGDLATVDIILNKGVDVLTLDKNGRAPMHYAVKGGNTEAIAKLLARRVDVYACDKNDYQPITLAIQSGNKEIFDILVGRADTVRSVTKDDGKTILLHAMDGGNVDIIRWATTNYSGYYNQVDKEGVNFVMAAVKDARPDIVRDIFARKCDTAVRDNKGKSVLMYAAEGSNPINLISALAQISSPQLIEARDKQGRTAFMYAVGGSYNQNIKQQRLLQRGADVNAKDNSGKSVLMYAVGNDKARVDNQALRELLYHNAQADARDKQGRTPLMYAAANPKASMTIIETLLNSGANVRAKDLKGKTVLMYAAESGDISKFRLLLESGASKEGVTLDGLTVQKIADKVGNCFARAVENLL